MIPPVRLCQPSDAPALAAFARRLFRLTYGATHPRASLSRYLRRELSARRVAAELSDPGTRVWLAAEAGRPAGYLWLREAAPPVPLPAKRPLHMRRLFVDPAWHGRGLAQALMDRCVAEAARRGADGLWLAVWQEAARPLAFYRKAGFAVAATWTFPMADHLDQDYLMLRPVAPSNGPA